ncbi:hypothetical protein [Acinetobacter sp. ANC 5502]
MKNISIFIACTLWLFTQSSYANEVYKCTTTQGITYQSKPCLSKLTQKKLCQKSYDGEFTNQCEKQKWQALKEMKAESQRIRKNSLIPVSVGEEAAKRFDKHYEPAESSSGVDAWSYKQSRSRGGRRR